MGGGSTLSCQVVLDAHCHATDSLFLSRHAEFCCCGSSIGIAKCPRGNESMVCIDGASLPVVCVLAFELLLRIVRTPHIFCTTEMMLTYLDDARFFAANNAIPMVNINASCTPINARMRCFTDSLAHSVDAGNLGRGFSDGLLSRLCGIKSSFSA